MALKADLRKLVLAQRRALTQQEIDGMSQQIALRFFTDFAPTAGETVHTFLPILHQGEINTWPIIRQLWEKYPQVQVAVSVANVEDFSMAHFLFTPDTQLQENKWGIPEPVNALPLPESEISTVLVPLLAFDLQGHRVGYGKGYYDRFLALLPQTSQKLGVSLFPPVERIDDVHAKDLTLDAVITPFQTYTF
ncbi:5-formyltetrahydrofolate cyclo-ligase [Rufibacter psychrotolerans]|uniref:5-formyltetrahydrofolate cyclo-ligase n=1 Tax=Rufibacter psychrotolerans TaxID=2812556 RepID=UPI0019671880|nr:5-formyltetrahydrofolate cyclo-ligase [Rufibacter sp. SYSU D00308]